MLAGLGLAGRIPPHGKTFCSPGLADLKALGIPGTPLRVATGHQPGFWHAGLAYKTWLAGRLVSSFGGHRAQFWAVDHEPLGELKFDRPGFPGLGIRKSWILANDKKLSGLCPASGLAPWPSDLGEGNDPWTENLENFGAVWERERARDQSAALAVIRPHLEFLGQRGAEVPELRTVTSLSADPGFLEFAHGLLKNSRGYRGAFNEGLAAVRRVHGVRHPALPLPDMADGDTPFWILDGTGGRLPLKLGSGGGRFEPGPKGPWALPSDPMELEAFGLLPRASTLTLYLRLARCDLFIHGLGGAAYEELNDFFWPGYDGRKLAPYAAATFTWFPGGDPGLRVSEAKARLRRGRTNPEELVRPGDGAWSLAEEKRALLAAGPRGRDVHLKIQSLNEALSKAVSGVLDGLVLDLERAQGDEKLAARDDSVLFMGAEGFSGWEKEFQEA